MTPERWARITDVFRSALERPAAERAGVLERACGGDDTLRRDVERLLAAEAEPTLPSPAAELLETAAMELVSGQTLAQYRVEAKIGEGGMGAVYRGYDTRLRRNVALKLLPPERFADLDRKRRLLREARAASALSHPNIVTIYEIGSQGDMDFIAMEYVQGKTLDELIPAKGLPPKKLFRYAVQIADALAKAHASGILHRDLKPSNIMVTEEDRIKVLDFGLAKMLEPSDASLDAPVVTEEGAVVGTAAYMSPEQAEGRKLDARSDIFSFGSVLYEMATGRRPFLADSRIALLGRIVNEDPQPPGKIAPLPPDLEKLILRCLRKETSRRYQTMADLKATLTDLETETTAPQESPASRLQPPFALRKAALFAAVICAAVALSWISARLLQRSPEAGPKRTVKFTFTPSQLLRGGNQEIDAEVSISPDGNHIAYVESQGGQLWIRDIDQEQARPVPGATSVYQVFWSPDNQYLGYSAGTCLAFVPGCNLVKIPVQGGTPVTIVTLQGGFRRASWSSDGQTILYAEWPHGLFTIPSRGGSPTRVLEHQHLEHPSFVDLPNGRRAYLYQAEDRNRPGGHGIYLQLEGDHQRRFITMSSSSNPYPAYSPTGHIIYVDGRNDSPVIWALPFSLAKLQPAGRAFPIVQRGSSPVVSRTGTLVYSDVPSNRLQLLWCDRTGRTLSTIGDPQPQQSPALSPDGRRLAIASRESGAPDIWLYDFDREIKTKTRIGAVSLAAGQSAWTPAGDEITYVSNAAGNADIVSKPSSGNGEPAVLAGTPLDEQAPDWSPGRKFLMYTVRSPETKADVLYRERREDGTLGPSQVFLRTAFNEGLPRFSPTGRFVVYMSDESGKNEIYVRDFPSAKNKWQISTSGGAVPRWRRDGKEIFYIEGGKLMAASVTTEPAFSPHRPVRLFDNRQLAQSGYDVSPDGKRFVVLERPSGEPPLAIHVVHNWFEEFRGK